MTPADLGLPTGTVTFLFSDIEGSTARWDAHRDEMQEAVRRHDEIMRAAIEQNGGYVFKTIGDAFCAAFSTVPDAAAAALKAQRTIGETDWSAIEGLRVRMAIHTGVADERDGDYFGPTVNRVARLLAVGHGGQILLSSAARDLVHETLPTSVALLDLGVHRLKDLSAPEHVTQLYASDFERDFPPLRSLDALPNNMPAYLTPLIGRDEELAEIEALVERARLVTLIGAGGIGKTRTALQAAVDLLRGDGDGVWFVDLSSLDDPALVPSAVAEALNIADEGGSRPLIERVAAALKNKRLLIVLDNCEHVVSAAADAADRLLQACPGLRILATSREPLGISGEEPYRMPGLPVPPEGVTDADGVAPYAAVALFVARAQAAQRGFTLTDENAGVVADVVRRLDGIALAIELAAPRLKVLNVRQLAQRLDERFKLLSGGSRTAQPRHQTLRALIGWSYDLLAPAEQSMLRQLAIFRGGGALDAAEAICADERFPDWDSLDLLSSLVDKSLVVVTSHDDEQRYSLLESTRQFALERLEEAGERAALAARHCRYFVRAAQSTDEAYWRADADAWTASVRLDLENYRSAISTGFGDGNDTSSAATLVGCLRWFWYDGARREGRALVERAHTALAGDASARERGLLSVAAALIAEGTTRGFLDSSELIHAFPGAGVDRTYRCEALRHLAAAAGRAGRTSESLDLFDRMLMEARASNIPRLVAYALIGAAGWNTVAGNAERAGVFYDEALAIARSCNDRIAVARVQVNRGETFFHQGNTQAALACVREAESIVRERGLDGIFCLLLANAAAYSLGACDFEQAWTYAREALDIAVRSEMEIFIGTAAQYFAHIAVVTGDPATAALLLGYADAVYERLDDTREATERVSRDRTLELIGETFSQDRATELMAQGGALVRDAAIAVALAIARPAESQASQPA